jgi:hypothetical protein
MGTTGDPNGRLVGLSANEIAPRAEYPRWPEAQRFNQRPDTLMQDPHRQLDKALLQRTAGPYIGSISTASAHLRHVGFPPIPTGFSNCQAVAKCQFLSS